MNCTFFSCFNAEACLSDQWKFQDNATGLPINSFPCHRGNNQAVSGIIIMFNFVSTRNHYSGLVVPSLWHISVRIGTTERDR